MSTIRLATSNMFKRLGPDQSRRHVQEVIARADVVVWQEVTRTHKRTLRNLNGWDHYFAGSGMAISWRTDRLTVHRPGRWRAVVHGIRHVDPARGSADIVLEHLRTGVLWPIVCTHMTHQAWTSHPERRPRWWYQAWRLARRTRRLANKYGRCVGGGDVNRHRWKPKDTLGEWPDGGTHGSRKYDVLWRRGRVELLWPAYEISTPSDHDSSVACFRAT